MNALTKAEVSALPALQMNESELIKVLQSSMYPGAAIESIKMVIGYCKATGLDPMMKPVHIVPMWDNKEKRMRDVIMPGVGLYRTQAARSGCAGVTEPEFGPDVTEKVGGQEITYPKWCRVTASRRLDTGEIVQFTAREFWMENYAVKGGQEKSIAPNAMWTKRPYGQIGKCAEAQALRKAFPESTGGQPTAEEMEGKSLDDGAEARTVEARATVVEPKAAPAYPQADFDKNLPAWRKLIASGKKSADQIVAMVSSKAPLTPEQVAEICKVPEPVVTDAAIKVTYAQVASAMHGAKDTDALDTAADLIGEVSDPEQSRELKAIYDKREAELKE